MTGKEHEDEKLFKNIDDCHDLLIYDAEYPCL